jgi:hypothetical protein
MDYGRALTADILMTGREFQVPYSQPMLDAIALFEELAIGYALIGGVAAMYYGRPRFTEDIDFVAISGHREKFAANRAIVEKHHFASDCDHKLYYQSGVQVDLWRDEFSDEIVNRAADVQLAGRVCRMIEVHDLLAMKLRAARLQDDYDVSEILRNNTIDESRLGTLVTPEQIAHFQMIKART